MEPGEQFAQQAEAISRNLTLGEKFALGGLAAGVVNAVAVAGGVARHMREAPAPRGHSGRAGGGPNRAPRAPGSATLGQSGGRNYARRGEL